MRFFLDITHFQKTITSDYDRNWQDLLLRCAFLAIGGLAYGPEVPVAVGSTLGYGRLVVDLPGVSDFQAHLVPGGIPLGSFFDLFRLTVKITIFLFVISCFFRHDYDSW